jgi:hypothetical protein
LRVARSLNAGKSFEPGVVIARKICQCCRTALATDARGSVYVVFRGATPDNIRDILIARSDDRGQTFSTPISIHDDGWMIAGCPHNGPAIAVDAADNVHVAWYTGREDRYGLYYAVSKNRGASFETPLHLNPHLPASPLRAALAVHKSGTVYLACEAAGMKDSAIYLLQPNTAANGHLRADSLAAGVYPAMAMNSNFMALAWLDGEAIRAMRKNF